jgi:hypothetical protein
MEAAHHPRRGFPQEKCVHLLAFAYQEQGDMVERAAEIGNEPFYRVWPGTEMVRVGQDHQFHLARAELLGQAFFREELVLPLSPHGQTQAAGKHVDERGTIRKKGWDCDGEDGQRLVFCRLCGLLLVQVRLKHRLAWLYGEKFVKGLPPK